ncbi:MAG: hypothetical protein RLZZ501_1466 [Pseudomonadota bacterium]|jgi:lysophospholipase L1-like esterase
MSEVVFTRKKIFIFSAIIIFAVLLLLEGASWAVISRFSETGSFSARAIENPFHPFLGWQAAPNYKVNTTKDVGGVHYIRTDADGNSITPAQYANPVLTVIVTGGSTMFGVGASDNDGTVPAQLERLLRERFGVDIKVVNLAVRGYTSFQEMLRLKEWLNDGHRADLVLSVSGRNDAYAVRGARAARSLLLPEHVWTNAVPLVRAAELQKPILLNPVGFFREHSYFIDLLARLVLRVTGGNDFHFDAADAPAAAQASQVVPEAAALGTAANYQMMAQLAQTYGADFQFVLQPTAYTLDRFPADIPALTQDPAKAEADRGAEARFYQDLRGDLDGRLALSDLTAALNGAAGTLYIDQCHYTDAGGALLAAALVETIAPKIQQRLAERERAPAGH